MRLIDADTLRAEFTGNFGNELWHYTGIWAVIDNAPTVPNVVPFVMCKDCYHRVPDDGSLFDGACYCDIHTESIFWDSDYCSYGEPI